MKKTIRSITFPIYRPASPLNAGASTRKSSNDSSDGSGSTSPVPQHSHHPSTLKRARPQQNYEKGKSLTAHEAVASLPPFQDSVTSQPTRSQQGEKNTSPLPPRAPSLTIHVQECLDEAFGLYVWPSSVKLASYLYHLFERYPEFFRGKRVIELGAG
jgi:hypothetical protein